MWSLNLIILFLCILISIAFLTLLERKILGLIQIRKGPNKVGISGILQPFSDALKLFTKTLIFPYKSTSWSFMMGPILAFALSLTMWKIFPLSFSNPNFTYSILFFMVISSSSVYSLSSSGWGSNSWYASIGCYRAIAQTISYEVNLALILLSLLFLTHTYNMTKSMSNNLLWLTPSLTILTLIWLASILAETNRTPYDFAEGESELVSGFNTEFSSSSFALLFLAEYGMIIFMAFLTTILFLQGAFMEFKSLLIISLILWIRGTSPRFRYDKLMTLAWTIFLPSCLSIFTFLLLFYLI